MAAAKATATYNFGQALPSMESKAALASCWGITTDHQCDLSVTLQCKKARGRKLCWNSTIAMVRPSEGLPPGQPAKTGSPVLSQRPGFFNSQLEQKGGAEADATINLSVVM